MKKKDIIKLVKESVQKVKEQAYGSATLTSQGQSIHGAPGIWENKAQELSDSYSLEELEARLKQIYREMEQEAEPEGGPIANQYADEIYQYEEAIRIAKGIGPRDKDAGKSYTEVVLSKLAGPNDAKEYDNEKHQLIIYPNLGSLQYKSRSSQEIVFTHIEGQPAFVRAFGNRPIYDELKKVLPEIPSPGSSQYSGFINILADEPIPMDNEKAIEMIKAMVKGKDAEAAAQSAFYTREPGRGGTGIDENLKKIEKKIIQILKKEGGAAGLAPLKKAVDKMDQPKGFSLKSTLQKMKNVEKHKNSDYILTPIKEQAPPPPPGGGGAPPGGGGAPKGPTDPDAKAEQDELMDLEREKFNIKIKYLNKKKSKASAQAAKQSSQAMKQIQKQIQQMVQQRAKVGTTPKPQPQKEIKIMENQLLSNYVKENININLKSKMNEHRKQARRQILMENALNQFFEYFDAGQTDEEIVQLYAQKGVSVPEQFVVKARKQHENFTKLKLELEMTEKEFKNSAENIVNNPATNEMDGTVTDGDKQLSSGLFPESE